MTRRSSRVTRQSTRQLDEVLSNFHTLPRPPSVGWISAIRDALGMTREQLAKRLGISRVSAYRLENDETAGRVTLNRLQSAAKALECELVYILVPRTSLEETVRQQARKKAQRLFDRVNVSQALEASAVTDETLAQQIEDLVVEYTVTRPAILWDD